ncbi:uncharacterized protein LOC133185938 [Saccostrea echinata]|uniref:uncharacterized protein LOC133185938 n=1 Tax=Saccostrea echinata TaxID=191078 RepID=UPI002A7F6E65|nr:uncharacterized protein LOC133185938 [Saccostrea echinata]
MDIRYCSATTTRYFQKANDSRINDELLGKLRELSVPPAKFKYLKEQLRKMVTTPEGWMFHDLPFKVQVHPCFSKLDLEFIGSTSEGLSISEVSEGNHNEELDLTAILRTITATESKLATTDRTWLEVEFCKENPGFVQLKVHMRDESDNWCGLCNIVSSQDGSINEFYLSPEAFTDEFFMMLCLRCSIENFHYSGYCKHSDKVLGAEMETDEEEKIEKSSDHFTFFIVNQEGPAVKTTLLFTESDISLQYDCSPVIICSEWPSVANEFKNRKRISGFPSSDFVERLTSMGCLIVPKYPKDSKIFLEWRLSFCLIERELMLSLTETQRMCYLLFKAIWRQFLCPPIGKALQSYHLKNVFLWECEQVPLRDWTETLMIARVRGLLQRLQYNLFTQNCPHYILPNNNLFKDIDQSLLFFAGMRVQTAIFQSRVVWIENDSLLYLPPHKCRTSLGKRLRNTCISTLKYAIEAMVKSAVYGLKKDTDSFKHCLDSETIATLESELRQSFKSELTKLISSYIQSSLVFHPYNITRTYICSRADPKQLLIASKSGLLDGIANLANTGMNWGNMVEVITSLEILETENLKEYGYSEDYKDMEELKLLLRMGMDDFGRFNQSSSDDDDDDDFYDEFEDDFVCDECDELITDLRYHCNMCPDFDICRKCYTNMIHPHKLDLVEMEAEENDASNMDERT